MWLCRISATYIMFLYDAIDIFDDIQNIQQKGKLYYYTPQFNQTKD